MHHKKHKAFPASSTRSHYSLGFTLVELIVVVTILAILATIGFVSYSSYLTGVRDTNRLAQLVSISDGLELYSTRNDLPLPDENVEVKIAGQTVSYQGDSGTNTLERIDFTKGGKDPKTGDFFNYYLTKNRKSFQLMSFLEEKQNLENAISIGDSIPVSYGKNLGILTDINGVPIQKDTSIRESGEINLLSDNNEYVLNFTNSIISGTGGYLADFVGLISNDSKILSENINGVALIDFDSDITDEFNNFTVQNIGNLKTVPSEKGKGLKCDGIGRLIIGSGATLLGGRDEFLVYTSYMVENE